MRLAPGVAAGSSDPDPSTFGDLGEPLGGPVAPLAAASGPESDALSRQRFADRWSGFRDGLSYGGRRDYYRLLGYKSQLLPQDYRARYKRGGIAERCVEAYPKATWSGGASIVEDPDPNNVTEFEDNSTSLFDRLAIWRKIIRADILTGLGRYGALLIGTTDSNLESELKPNSLSGPESIIYINALSEDRAQIQQSVTDTTSPRFGLPEYYMCHLGIPAYSMTDMDDDGPYGGSSHAVTRRVHHSRIIHIAEQCLFDDVFGKPRLRAVWNYLDDLVKVTGGGAESSWQRVNPGLHLNIDKDLRVTPDELKKLHALAEDYQHSISHILPTRGVDLKMLNALVDKWGPNQDAITRLICAVLGIPHRVLMGSERGEMASTQDRDNWSDRVAERRMEFGIPLVRALIDRLQLFGALPSADDYEVQWPDEEELNEQEKGALLISYSTANANNFRAGGGLILTNDEMRDQVLSLPPIVSQAPTTDAAGNPIDPTQVAADGSTEIVNPADGSRPLNNTPTSGDTAGTGTTGNQGSGATGAGGPSAADQQRMVQPDLVVGDPKATQPKASSVAASSIMAPVLTSIRFASSGKVVPIAKIRSAGLKRLVATKISTARKMRRKFGGHRAAPFAPGGGRDSSHPNDAHGNARK
jgi:hypothetical protein